MVLLDAFDDELLELVEVDPQKKKRKRQGKSKSSSSKRRKADVSDSDQDEPESEEDGPLYPLEGRYTDDADKQRLMQMSEIEREDILAQRLEEVQKTLDRKAISQMVRSQQNGGNADSVSSAAKRQHTARGSTKEKTRKLDELRAKRKAKDDKKRNKSLSPKHERSSSPMDMSSDEDDDDEEDGQISKYEEEDRRERRLQEKDEEPISLAHLETCRLSRDMIVKNYMTPWFEDFVKGAWVRYLIGSEVDGTPVYRICEVTNLAAELVKPYKIEQTILNQVFELKHGESTRTFSMDKVSNSAFTEKEFDRLTRTCAHDKVRLPTRRELESKNAQMLRLATQPMTERDISAMLARKNQISATKHQGRAALERSRLTQARTLAERRHDYNEVKEIDAKLATLGPEDSPRKEEDDMLAKVSERNRKANADAMRRIEAAEAEKKRREKKLALAGKSGTATPTDPSARLKTVPRTFNNTSSLSSRPGTPGGTPLVAPQDASGGSVSPLPRAGTKSFETTVVNSIELDLGDF